MSTEKKITKAEVERRIEGLSEAKQKEVVCALVGHSEIISICFGYVSCARCNAQIGDTLGGSYPISDAVIMEHDCSTCHANFAKLDWRSKLFVKDPFERGSE